MLVDLNYFDNQGTNTTRNFELRSFPNIKLNQNLTPKKTIVRVNDNFIFKSINYNEEYDYYLDGFWQCERYFQDAQLKIREELTPSKEKLLEFRQIISTNSVSLHIRRSDYLTSNGFHPVQTLEYYKNAINKIGKYENLYVFSDDIYWCKNNLEFKNMVFVEGKTNIEDLWLMSLCDHNIIANSSFSWWGAWLNNNPNKMVIAPKLWFGQHVNINSGDIVPDEWIKL